MQQGNLMMYF